MTPAALRDAGENRRTLSDAHISRLTTEQLNGGLRCYREDLRYSRADALRAAELWNASKVSTRATVVTVDGLPSIMVTDVAGGAE